MNGVGRKGKNHEIRTKEGTASSMNQQGTKILSVLCCAVI